MDVWSQKSCEKRRKDTTSIYTTFFESTTVFESIGDDSAELSEDESLADSNNVSTDISEDQTSRLSLIRLAIIHWSCYQELHVL